MNNKPSRKPPKLVYTGPLSSSNCMQIIYVHIQTKGLEILEYRSNQSRLRNEMSCNSWHNTSWIRVNRGCGLTRNICNLGGNVPFATIHWYVLLQMVIIDNKDWFHYIDLLRKKNVQAKRAITLLRWQQNQALHGLA